MQHELTLTFIPSPHGIDWSTPKSLAKSAVINKISLKPRFIGHVFVELKGEIDSKLHHIVTGMSSKKMDTVYQVLIKQKGFGVLFHSFAGKMEKKEDLEIELARYYQEGRVSYVKYQLNPLNFKRLVQYVEEFQKNKGDLYYGGPNRPRHLEGSGCSAFGMSFLEIAGILTQDMVKSWSQSIRIPLKFAGAPLTDKKISLLSIIQNAHAWAEENEPHQPFFIWDPDLMHKWVLEKIKNHSDGAGYHLHQKIKSQGVVFDYTHLPPLNEPLFFNEQSALFKKSIGQ